MGGQFFGAQDHASVMEPAFSLDESSEPLEKLEGADGDIDSFESMVMVDEAQPGAQTKNTRQTARGGSAGRVMEGKDSAERQRMLNYIIKSNRFNEKTNRRNLCVTCTICGRQFIKVRNTLDHVRTHFKSKPFSCKFCGRTFTQIGNRDRHERFQVCQVGKFGSLA
mmetsp:Transcript_45393/g.60262  ORF Transcript_45393/g.60262 Transcript_45393/m.60262 type:complete len:166 (+) Transcript_45393:587-1084(+)